ncbi:unnamed protein product [Clonostachys byssicola]|uniref:Ras guanine nucleotide exchange factor A n=1 Tax=Clonostachys byssicola TaxID=160290 RepID=A0A9N9U8D7_9HYPO|nr:unnamed protein product [Clonostachys byssicola]
MLSKRSMPAEFYVAPLATGKVESNASGYSDDQETSNNIYRQPSEMTPPATPNGSYENLAPESEGPLIFHNFLRAFYPFDPTYAMTDSSITLPLNEGDIVLIHSIHTNGWADGTLLASGARGWLPTNYCESYEPPEMRNLLKALLNFWDLLRSSSVNDSEIFGNQEFMKGMIAGVRFLLQRTNCLNRESPVIQRCDGIRRCRKSLMSELSSLVKTAKRMQESQREILNPTEEDVNDIVDEMILKALRIVTKAVRFMDTLDDNKMGRVPAPITIMDTVPEETPNLSTPPADPMVVDSHQGAPSVISSEASTLATLEGRSPAPSVTIEAPEMGHDFPLPSNKRLSSLNPSQRSQSPAFSHRLSQGSNVNSNRTSSISHRVSLVGPASCLRRNKLALECLNRSHDAFLSHLGSFIGRLHQSQSSPELSSAIKQCAGTGGRLLGVIDAVITYNQNSNVILVVARGALFDQIHHLVFAARDTIVNSTVEEADLIMPQDNHILLTSATGCVRTAGDCVAKARTTIEWVGDFELEKEDMETDLGIDLTILDDAFVVRERKQSAAGQSDSGSVADSTCTAGSATPGPRQLGLGIDKPLPDVPEMDIAEDVLPATETRPSSKGGESVASTTSPASSRRQSIALPNISTVVTEQVSQDEHHAFSEQDYHASSGFDSLVASSAGSSATFLSRDSEASVTSQGSTRASTPDHTHVPRNQPSMSELSASAASNNTEEVEDLESRLMEKTFAHELMFNREGQVTGGTLPALVERLTTHEAAPDAMFVSTFYLTFRLFCSPLKLAETLIDRFEYVGESPHMSGPVRLRVYNAFKGWLETHWRDETDREALDLITTFAEGRLSELLPPAGRRLVELAHRVSGGASLVPRLVSSMGKTNTSVAQYVPAETPVPATSLSKSQQNLLSVWKSGGASPNILDFEPIELARQLTVKQMNIFCAISPEELLASQWMKNGGVDAPNVKAMSALSTDISNLVADTILQFSEIKKRAAVLKQWIKIAHHCLELNNYDGLMAIICSLNSSTISRLRKTWDTLSVRRKTMLRTLQELVEPSQNNKILRTRLHDHVPPCLPFLGMYLTDLTFVDIGNPPTKQMSFGEETDDHRASGMTVINFDKHARTAKIIGELQRFQIPYRLNEVPDMQDWFGDQINKVREGDQGKIQVTYYRKSLLLEPRETAVVRTPTEPTPPIAAGSSRTDLFGWMSRDRAN